MTIPDFNAKNGTFPKNSDKKTKNPPSLSSLF